MKQLLLGTESAPGTIAGRGMDENGVPYRRVAKDVLHEGVYIHPKDGWRLNVTSKFLDKMVETYKKMMLAGVKVELTKDHSPSADAVVGKVLDVWVDTVNTNNGPRLALFSLNEFRGEQAIDLSERNNQVSVEIETFTDSKGNEWSEALTAVSVVQRPVIPGQRDFIAASMQNILDKDEAKMLFFDLNSNSNPPTVKTMKNIHAAIRKSFSLADDVELPEDEAKLAEKVLELSAAAIEGRKGKMDDKDKEIAKLKAQIEDMRKEGKKASTLTDDQREVLADRADMVKERGASLVGQTIEVTPAVVEKLCASLIPAGDTNKKIMLSRGTEGAQPIARQVIDALAEAATGKANSQSVTGPQHLSLDSTVGESTEEGKSIVESMRAVAGCSTKKD